MGELVSGYVEDKVCVCVCWKAAAAEMVPPQ